MATAPPLTDAVLVRRLRERDRTAWGELYSAYGPRLRAFALRLAGNAHDADDLVQETFVRALPRLDRLDPDTVELGPYLFTALRNTFLKQVERSRRMVPTDEVPEPDVPVAIEDDPERGTLLASQQEEVRAANANLAPRQRLVLALRELEDRSSAEIGEVVGLNENAVAQLISRARESLRTELRLAQVDPGRLPEECRAFLPLLSRHLDGALRGAQLERTLAHLEGCERCQDALASMQEASRRYRSLFPLLVGAEEARAAEIDAALEAAGYWRSGRLAGWRSSPRRMAALLAATIAVLAGAGAGTAVLVTGERARPAVAPPAPASSTSPTTAPGMTAAVAATTAKRPAPTTTPAPETKPEPKPKPKPRPKAAPATAIPPTTTAPTTVAPATTTTATAAPATVAPATTSIATTAPPAPSTSAPPAKTPSTPKAPTKTSATPPPAPPPAASTTTRTPVAPADTTPPTVTLTSRPPASTRETSASFAFRSSEAGSTFQCRLDAGGFSPCTSPRRHDGLAPGPHVFSVRARDQAGNTGPETTAHWEIVVPDTTPPTTTIISASTEGGDASFGFEASEPDVSFACSLDGGPFDPCTSPKGYAGLQPGTHSFAVRATDAAGNTGPPATTSWTIPRPLPNLVITALTATSVTVANVGNAPAGAFVVSITNAGPFTFGGLAPGQSQTRTWTPCRAGAIRAVADSGGMVAESNEADNERSFTASCLSLSG